MTQAISFFKPSGAFIDELADYLRGKQVLEIFAGNGLMAQLLSSSGVSITATSLLSGHDGHQQGMNFSVEEMEARIAVQTYGDNSDVLLVSWPVADQSILPAVDLWGSKKPIVYIGEAPNPTLPGLSGLPGCACDEFFERITWEREFESYPATNMLEKAGVVFYSGEVR